jgi:hypothetical protein
MAHSPVQESLVGMSPFLVAVFTMMGDAYANLQFVAVVDSRSDEAVTIPHLDQLLAHFAPLNFLSLTCAHENSSLPNGFLNCFKLHANEQGAALRAVSS